MCIQTPGSFLWAGSLAARVGWEGWSTWFIYVVTGLLQGAVLTMGITFEVRNWKRRKAGEVIAEDIIGNGHIEGEGGQQMDPDPPPEEEDERTALLGNERRS